MRIPIAVTAAVFTVLFACTAGFAAEGPVTFHKDVEPILQKNCQNCHRPGQVAPMSFLTYQDVRPWVKAMKAAVVTRKMPPWFADPHYGSFLNDRSLKQSDIDIVARWADAGAPEGNIKDAPPAVQWPTGWLIQPDVVVEGPTTDVPASTKNNVVEWMTVIMPTGFTKDTWVSSVQIKPEFPVRNPSHLHRLHSSQSEIQIWRHLLDGQGSGRRRLGASRQADLSWRGTRRSTDADPTPPPGGAEDCYLPGKFRSGLSLDQCCETDSCRIGHHLQSALHAERDGRDKPRQSGLHHPRIPRQRGAICRS